MPAAAGEPVEEAHGCPDQHYRDKGEDHAEEEHRCRVVEPARAARFERQEVPGPYDQRHGLSRGMGTALKGLFRRDGVYVISRIVITVGQDCASRDRLLMSSFIA